MIVYLVTAPHAYTIDRFVRHWSGSFRRRMKVLPYERIPPRETLPRGVYVFSDLERLTGERRERAADLRAWLAEHRPGSLLLNDPARSLGRYELLRMLQEEGVNDFRAWRIDEPRGDLRFPVFVRHAREHDGSFSMLLFDAAALDRAVTALLAEGFPEEDLLIVEFRDTSDRGVLFRKYSAFAVAGRIVPRQLFFGRDWMLKQPGVVDPEKVREEMEYLETNPHRAALEEIFRLARIDYGRIDYSVLDGSPRVWEINTNPVVVSKKRGRYKSARRGAQVRFGEEFLKTLREVDASVGAPGPRDRLRGLRLLVRR